MKRPQNIPRKKKLPKSKILALDISKDKQIELFKKSEEIFTPNFESGSTPSIEKCLDSYVDNFRKQTEILNSGYQKIDGKWSNKKGFGANSFDKATEEVRKVLNDVSRRNLNELHELVKNPPSKLKKMQKACFRDFIKVHIENYYEQIYPTFALYSSPCFFEPSDFEPNSLDKLLETKYYRYDGKFKTYQSAPAILRTIRENNKEIQKVKAKLIVDPLNKKINLKYMVFNRDDKLDVVVGIKDNDLSIRHYDVEMHTLRGGKKPDVSYKIIQSGKTGNFIIKTESGRDSELFHKNRDQMEAYNLFRFLSNNPIFLGGNGFLNAVDYTKNKQKQILEAEYRKS